MKLGNGPLAAVLSLIAAQVARAGVSCPDTSGDGPKLGAVASESAICSRIGTRLLEDGGNAVDALVGTVFCVGVIGMYHSGIGGGGFMLVRAANGSYEFVDFREMAPAAATQDMYKANVNESLFGGLASGVPGELRGTEYVHKRYGVLPWADVMAPAIKLARYGFPVSQDLVNYIQQTPDHEFLTTDPAWAIDFAPRGCLLGLGETMTRKRYADTLETIAQNGADAYYQGPIANATINAIRASKGIMTLEDLKNYTVAIRDPVSINYRGHKLTSTNAPSSGIVCLSALNTLSGYSDFQDPSKSNLSTHRLDEAMKWAYAERTTLGDPSFVSGLDDYTHQMISAQAGEETRAKISDTRTYNVSYYDPKALSVLSDHGTSAIMTADKDGMAVSITTTINTLFGSQVIVPETGVILNNEMNDFSVPGETNAYGYKPSEANYIKPHKRPLSSISPVIGEKDGKLFFAIGAAGGSRITTATMQNIIHLIDGNMTAAEALVQPRLHDQLIPASISFEYSYNNDTVAYLKGLGSNVTWVAPGQSTAQGIRRSSNGVFDAAGEPRQKASGGFAV